MLEADCCLTLMVSQTWLDALYFSVTTLTTVRSCSRPAAESMRQVGYGDKTPATDGGRMYTIFYGMVGVMLISSWLGTTIALLLQLSSPNV